MKLGCVFTQTTTNEQGRAVRDEDSTNYTTAIEAWRRGWRRAEKEVVIGDGAVSLWNLADQQFLGTNHRSLSRGSIFRSSRQGWFRPMSGVRKC